MSRPVWSAVGNGGVWGVSRYGRQSEMKVAFEALIKEVNHKSLVSGDKATWVKLEFESAKQIKILNALNKLHQADKTVMVVIMDEKK